jgi:radical SAM-linked protein
MYRLRIKHQKTGDLRFLSHLDLVRAFERGARRAGLPFSFTQGFSPHPKISFGPPLPVGVSSESEYIDFVVEEELPLDEIMKSLSGAFPEDLRCTEARYVELNSPSLMSLISTASYKVTAFAKPVLNHDRLKHLLDSGLNKPEIQLPAKDGERTYQTRKIVKDLVPESVRRSGEESAIELRFVGLLANAGGVRPDVFIKGLFSLGEKDLHLEFGRIHRTGLYHEERGCLVAP